MIATCDAKSSTPAMAVCGNTIDLYTLNVQSFGHMKKNGEQSGVGPPEWKRRWTAWRNRVLGSASFQDWAARAPLFSLVARRKAAQVFDLVAGFSYTQVLLAVVQVNLLDLLDDGPCNAATIAAHSALSPDAALRLVRAATALDLAEEVAPGWWMLGQQGAALRANHGALAMIRHHPLLYADLADPVALLKSDRQQPTALADFWRYGAKTPGETADRYSELMATSQAMVAREAIAAYRFKKHKRVLDVGGGHGAFVSALATACPDLALGVFDLPPVIAGTGPRLDSAGLTSRVALHPGDFFNDPIPRGYDCVTLVRILHDHDDAQSLELLRAIRRSLPPGGRLVIAEPMASTPGARAMGDGYFGMYLWAMNSGRPRSAAEYGAMLQTAGFARWSRLKTSQPVITSVVVSSS